MATPEQGRRSASQTFRAVYHYGTTSIAVKYAPTANIALRFDSKSKQHFVLWRDVTTVFKDALYILDGADVVPFVADEATWEELQPRRIPASPGVVLDVVLSPSNNAQPLYAIMGDVLRVSSPQLQETPQNLATRSGPQMTPPSPKTDISAGELDAKSITEDSKGLYSHDNSSETSIGSSDDSGGSFYSADEESSIPSRKASQAKPNSKRTSTFTLGAQMLDSGVSMQVSRTENKEPDEVTGVAGVNKDEVLDSIDSKASDIEQAVTLAPTVSTLAALVHPSQTDFPSITLVPSDETNQEETTVILSNGTTLIPASVEKVLAPTVPKAPNETVSTPVVPVASNETVSTPVVPVVSNETSLTPIDALTSNMTILTPHETALTPTVIVIENDTVSTPSAPEPPTETALTPIVPVNFNEPISDNTPERFIPIHNTPKDIVDWSSRPRMGWNSQPKRILGQRGPQAYVDPLNLAEAPKDVQGRVLEYMEQLESSSWHEAPMPRLFIVLPTTFKSGDTQESAASGFRLFWMCEYSCDHPDGAEDYSGNGSTPYLQDTHPGFELDKPSELFQQFGVHLLLNLQLFMYSRRNLATGGEAHLSARRGSDLGYDQGIEFLRKALKMDKEKVERSLSWMIDYLFSRTLESTVEGQLLPGLDRTINKPPQLTPDDLIRLRTFIRLPPTGPGTYGTLYRSVDDDGHVQWVCSTHFYELHPFFFPEYIHEAARNCGGYDYAQDVEVTQGLYSSQTGSIGALPRNNIEALNLYSALVAGSGCVPEMCLRFQWNVTLEDIVLIRDAILNFGVVSLGLTGPGLCEASPSHSEVMIQIMVHQRIQILALDSAQAILKHIHPLLLTKQFLGLRALHLQLKSSGRDSDDIGSGLTSVIANSPNIKELTVDWEEFEEVLNIQNFLERVAKDRPQPIYVILKIRQQEIALFINNEEFQHVNIKSSSISVASTNPLVSGGKAESLAITDFADILNPEEGSTLWCILSLSVRLKVLAVNTNMSDFQRTSDAISQIVNTHRPKCILTRLLLSDRSNGEVVPTFFTDFPLSEGAPSQLWECS
ncbi:hypothetical protein BGX27_011210 [Mortierella sp. AM989]|nr:hypothetical protein BGX27_011210 [Mortierella sp. AM989]